MINTEIEIPKAVLVGIQAPKSPDYEVLGSLQELTRLVTTLGYPVIGQMVQKRASTKGAMVLGEGKLQELAAWTGGTGVVASAVVHKKSKAALKFKSHLEKEVEIEPTEHQADDQAHDDSTEDAEELLHAEDHKPKEKAGTVIFDCDLSPSQLRNLESALGVPVLDRTGVIIEIFSRHARTRAAKLQVEIARLAYVAPRLRETGGGGDRQGGGVGGKGAGETSLELDRRKIRDRIKELKEELAAIDQEYLTRRARRDQENKVALVGYTNAGKSSLMRAMTGSEVLIADKLFATLDTTVRLLHPETRPKILISDTVGFIKKLPHDLVASFKSTLDEALNASLLLFVVDAADSTFRAQYEVTRAVLAEVGAEHIPSFLILNKRDQLRPEQIAELKGEFPEAIFLSTRDAADILALRERLIAYFETDMVEEDLFLPYTLKGAIGEIRAQMRVLNETYRDDGQVFRVRASKEKFERLKAKYKI